MCEYDKDDPEWFLENVCGMMGDGQCVLAGTEECDWECPRSHMSPPTEDDR